MGVFIDMRLEGMDVYTYMSVQGWICLYRHECIGDGGLDRYACTLNGNVFYGDWFGKFHNGPFITARETICVLEHIAVS